jgi:hypothetical protein
MARQTCLLSLFQNFSFGTAAIDNYLKIFYIIFDSLRFHKKGPLRRPFFYLWAGFKGRVLPAEPGALGACCTCGFFRYFVPQKSRLSGSLRSLRGKKSPVSRFFGILRAKRNKLLGGIKRGN